MAKTIITNQIKSLGIKLTQEQRKAVESLTGASIINAGAGSGKTTSIVAKLMYAHIQDPSSYSLVISFTKKAVYELQSRLSNVANVTCSTLHSFFWRILRSNGYKHFKIIENDAQRILIINRVITENKLEAIITPQDFLEAIAKHKFKTAEMQTLKEAYLEELKNQNLVCFDSIQYFTYELLISKPSITNRIRNLYDYVLLDESQDLSIIQAAILKLIWADRNSNITFVGDPMQSIYSFRGSQENVMQELQNYYDSKVFNLTLNHRSTSAILNIANKVLPNANHLVPMKKKIGNEPVFKMFPTSKDEALYVCSEIKRLLNSGKKLSDIAILFRSSPAVSEIFEELISQQIPTVKYGSDCTKWFNSRFKKIIALLNLAYGISNTHYLRCVLPIFNIPLSTLEENCFEDSGNIKKLLLDFPSLSRKQKEKLEIFFNIDSTSLPLQELVKKLWDLILKDHFETTSDQILNDFLEAISKFENFTDLRLCLNKIRQVTKYMARLANDPTADYVRLLSIHTSKGMEFDTVFLCGAADGILPDTTHDTTNLSEENRLAYVAITRAKELLYVTYSSTNNDNSIEPSRFFKDQFNKV